MILKESVDSEIFTMYSNILGIITNLNDPKISNIHSVKLSNTRYGFPNITFDYDKEFEVMINIYSDYIQIIAPDDLYCKFKTLIASTYPDYEDIITMQRM